MPYLNCPACDQPVREFYTILEPGTAAQIQESVRAHAPSCSGKKPAPLPREQQPHRYTDGRPFTPRPKGPCALCRNGARHHLHYLDGRYL